MHHYSHSTHYSTTLNFVEGYWLLKVNHPVIRFIEYSVTNCS